MGALVGADCNKRGSGTTRAGDRSVNASIFR